METGKLLLMKHSQELLGTRYTYSPRRSLYSGPNSFVDSHEVSPEIGLQNAESFY